MVDGGRSKIVFILFGHNYLFNQDEIGELLGFQTKRDAVSEVPRDHFMPLELDSFWRKLIRCTTPNPERNTSSQVHSPTIWYFQTVLAQTFFGKSDDTYIVSKK